MLEPLHLPDEERHPPASPTKVVGSGKRQSRESIVAPGINPVISSITQTAQGSLSIYCHRLHRLFLVDSGADVSVYTAGVEDRRLPPSSSLTAANGTRIDTYGLSLIHI